MSSIILIVFFICAFHSSCTASLLTTLKRLPLTVEQGKFSYLSHAHIPVDQKLKSADICQIEVDDVQPLSSSVGVVKPKKFPCFFSSNSVRYQHEGSNLTTADEIHLNIYFFRKQYSSVQNVTITVNIIPSRKPSRITVKSPIIIKSWKGISQAIGSKLIKIHYDPMREFCRMRHFNQAASSRKLQPWLATRFWPQTGILITFNKSKVYEFNFECQQALLMGFRFMHRKSHSSHIDFLPLTIEIIKIDTDELVDLTCLHIPIYISSKPFLGIWENIPSPPIIKAFRSITLTNSGGTLSLLPSDCLELSNQDKDRGPLIVQILSIQGGYHATFRNLRDPSKSIWNFIFNDLVNGLIAFQLLSYSDVMEKVFRIDLIIMDSYFVKSDVLILKLINILESKDQPFQVFTTPFFTYTSSNRPLRHNNIQIVGHIDLNYVRGRIISQNISSGSFYKYPSTVLLNKAQSEFLLTDIRSDLIFYKHDGSLRESDLVNVEVSIDQYRSIILQMPIYIVRVYNRTKESLLAFYSEFSIPKEGIFKLTINRILNRNFYFYIHLRDHCDAFFDIITHPRYGNVVKLLPGKNVSSSHSRLSVIHLRDLLDGLIFYQNTITSRNNQDSMELKQHGRLGDKRIKIIFNIQRYVKNFLLPKMNPNILFTVAETNQYQKLSYLNLNYVNYFLQPEDIVYHIVSFPRFDNANGTVDSGRLISLKSIQNDILVGDTALTTKITNYRAAHITSVTTFTQGQILEGDIVYVPPVEDIGPEDKNAFFLYSVKDIDGYEIRNIPFNILIKAVNNQPPVLKGFDIVVSRDEEIFLTFSNLNIQDEDTERTNVIVEIVTLPLYGVLFDGRMKIVKSGYQFPASKLNEKFIRYKHSGHNIDKDNFNVRLFDGIQTSQIFNVLINITKRIIQTSNWNFYINNSIIVKENSTVTLHISIFQNVLKNFDFKTFPNPMFIIVALPTSGNLLNKKVVVSTFHYDDIFKGFISYQHISMEIGAKPKFDFTQVWILETGESFNLNFTVQPVNSQPPSFYSQVPLQVNEGGSAIISYYSISFTDLDSDEKNIVVQVIKPPIWGTICNKGEVTSVKSFSIQDIKLGKIIYNNSLSGNGSEQTSDVFTIRGSDGKFLSAPLEIQIFIHSVNDEPPNLFLSKFNIAVGEKRILDDNLFHISDADVPRDNIQIVVSKFPHYGNLSLNYKYGEMKFITRTTPPLTLQLLKFAHLVYIQNKRSMSVQNQKFPIKDVFELTVTDGKFVVTKNATVNITGYNKVAPVTILSLIQLHKVDEKVISTSELNAVDPDTLSSDIIFTLLKIPEKGNLFLGNRKLVRLQTFTQKDIEDKQLKYKYMGSLVTFAKDYFLIKLFDGSYESTSKQVFIFLTQPVQFPKMTISMLPAKVTIGQRYVLDKSLFVIKNPIADIVNSLVITIKGKLTCGAFYYYKNLDYQIVKFTFEDLKERRILLLIPECPEVVKVISVSVYMYSHKNFKQDTTFTIDIIPRVKAVPNLKRNSSITTLVGSNVLLTQEMLLVNDEDTSSDKIIYKHVQFNNSFIQIFVNNVPSQIFSQNDINTEKVELHVAEDVNTSQSNITLLVSDGDNDGYIFGSHFQISGFIVLPIIFKNWKRDNLILLKYTVPTMLKFVHGYSAFQWTYNNFLVSRPDAEISVAKELVSGFFYNVQSKQPISSFSQTEINRGKIFYFLQKDKSSRIYKELIRFKISYQNLTLLSEILELQWSIIEFEKIKYKICLQRGLLSINVVRIGNLSSYSEALVGFVSMEAIINQDFRLMSDMRLKFTPGENRKSVSIKILMTGSVLKDNRFQVTLKSPKQTILGQKSITTISIKNRKTCENKEYFLAEKRSLQSKRALITNTKTIFQDFGNSNEHMNTNNDEEDVPSSDDLERHYNSYLLGRQFKIRCTRGWLSYSRRCYRIFKSKMSWSNANKQCLKYGSYLASVTSESTLQWLLKFFQNQKPFWIGLHRLSVYQKRWTYTNNEAVIYTKWAPGFPKYQGIKSRNCVLVTLKGDWKNRPCDKKKASFVCMKNPGVWI